MTVTYSTTVVPQVSMNTKMRSNAFAAYGALSAYGVGSQRTAFIEQVCIQLPLQSLYLVSSFVGCWYIKYQAATNFNVS